ncbi:hypothetical protein [Paraburkholderia sp.]|uniref:hypothetical protein n=1 Tax=Paraburkholderia sp. TaxID=1926495 RepID=UPI0039E24543
MKVKRVASYQTTDGQTFADKKAAQAHQKEVDRRKALKDLIDDKLEDDLFSGDVTSLTLVSFILENADAIRSILPQRAKPEPDFVGELISAQAATSAGAANAAQGQAGAGAILQ